MIENNQMYKQMNEKKNLFSWPLFLPFRLNYDRFAIRPKSTKEMGNINKCDLLRKLN